MVAAATVAGATATTSAAGLPTPINRQQESFAAPEAAACQPTTSAITASGVRLLEHVSLPTGRLRSFRVGLVGEPLQAEWDVPSTATPLPQFLVTSNGNGGATILRDDAYNEFALEHAQRTHNADMLVGSVPVIVGMPSLRGDSERRAYDAFSRAQRNRRAMIYIITGDGMLRGFDVATGVQTLGFAPASFLTRSAHSSDGAAAYIGSSDAFFSGSWHSVVVGTDASTVFALDVTNPVMPGKDERRFGSPMLWEFGDDAGSRRSFTQPVIARLSTGVWAAIFGGSARGDEAAALFVLDMATGKAIRKINVPQSRDPAIATAPNALTAPAAVNIDRDDAIELVYAGDQRGNLWKFDLSARSADDWHLTADEQPIFKAQDGTGRPQPIVTQPVVIRAPSGSELLVFFGANSPSRAKPAQSSATLYAFVDGPAATPSRSGMRRMQIAEYEMPGRPDRPGRARSITALTGPSAGNGQGWYLDLPALAGEHFSTQPTVRDSKLIFGTQQAPSFPCLDAVEWTFVLDPAGADETIGLRATAPEAPGGAADDTHSVSARAISAVATVGVHSSSLASPAIVETVDAKGACAFLIFPRTTAAGAPPLVANCRDPSARGRQSWRQLL